MSLRSSRAESPWAIGITAIVLIAIDVLVIWALATTGQTVAARS